MHREVTHNKFHASFGHFVEAIFYFFGNYIRKCQYEVCIHIKVP